MKKFSDYLKLITESQKHVIGNRGTQIRVKSRDKTPLQFFNDTKIKMIGDIKSNKFRVGLNEAYVNFRSKIAKYIVPNQKFNFQKNRIYLNETNLSDNGKDIYSIIQDNENIYKFYNFFRDDQLDLNTLKNSPLVLLRPLFILDQEVNIILFDSQGKEYQESVNLKSEMIKSQKSVESKRLIEILYHDFMYFLKNNIYAISPDSNIEITL